MIYYVFEIIIVDMYLSQIGKKRRKRLIGDAIIL